MRPITGFELATAWDAVSEALAHDNRTLEAGALQSLLRVGEQALREAVSDARTRGATWDAIALSLGVSRQAAARRFGATQTPQRGGLRGRSATPPPRR